MAISLLSFQTLIKKTQITSRGLTYSTSFQRSSNYLLICILKSKRHLIMKTKKRDLKSTNSSMNFHINLELSVLYISLRNVILKSSSLKTKIPHLLLGSVQCYDLTNMIRMNTFSMKAMMSTTLIS